MKGHILIILSALGACSLSAQVNFQNGSAAYEIPIFSFSDSKCGLASRISLSYSSGNGLIVSDKASNIGQNWALVAGGSITRKQNGEPDDQNSTSAFPVIPNGNFRGFNESIATYDDNYQSVPWAGDPYSRDYIDNYYPNGFIYSEFPLDMIDGNNIWPLPNLAPREMALNPRFRNSMDKRWKLSRRALTDRQQDIFVYNVNGMAGEFVLGKDGNILLINDSKVIITKSTTDLTGQNIRTRINEFTLKDDIGMVYKFSAYELAEVMRPVELSSEGPNSFKKIISSSEPSGKYTIQRWLLTEIINPVTNEKIIFEYENIDIDFINDKTPSYQFTEGQTTESVQVYEQRSKGKLQRLKNIIFPDGHKAQFIYKSMGRYDIPTDFPVEQIKILYGTEEIINYSLTYGYFFRKEIKNYLDYISESDKRFARLCLTSVQKNGTGISEPSYKFDYYTGSESSDPKDIVPPFDCMAQDHWGYYNKSAIVNNEEANPSKEVLKDLMLNNTTYRQPSPGAAKLGLLKAVENPFGGKSTFEYEQNDSKDSDNPALTKATGGVRVFRTTLSDGITSASDIVTTYNYKLADGSTSGWGYETPVYLNRREVKIWNASTPDGYTKEGVVKFDVTTAFSKFVSKQIANAAFKVAVKSSMKITQAALIKAGKTTVVVPMPEPVSIIATIIISGLVDRLFSLFNPNDYIWTNTYGFFPFQAQNPIGINYSRVEIINTSLPGGTGKTIMEFTAPSNVRTEIPAYTMPYSPKQRFAGWKYGLPYRTAIYNQSGTMLSETVSTYSILSNTVTNDNHKSSKVEVVRPESASCTAPSSNIPITDFSWEFYYPITGRAELIATTEKNFGLTGVLSQAEATYAYNTDYLNKSSTATNSKGDVIKAKTYYPNDYNNISTAIQEMKVRNMVTVPISTETWLIKSNGDEYLVDATVNEFGVLPNGEIKVSKIYTLEAKQPLIKSLIGEQSPSILVRNSTYFKEQLSFNYDNNGILQESVTPQLNVNTQMYDYNDRVVTVTVSNATKSEIAYSSFETDQKGAWQYELTNIILNSGVTGRKVFHFPTTLTSITRVVTGTKNYILSFWYKGTGITLSKDGVNLTANKTVTNPVSGWVYREYTFTGGGVISISNSADANVDLDELRLYPKDARMATVAYNPKVGKTTECDINNKLVYYEYDGLNRLQYVKDDRGNILKKICYNYAGEPENCLDPNDTSPQWRPTGVTRCQPCPANGNFNSGIKENLETDLNPASSTYGTPRWSVDPTGSCPTPPSWVTINAYCELALDPPYEFTGNQVINQTDVNPCSPTYNQSQQITIVNTTACPVCSPACNVPSFKCINGVCTAGVWSIIKVVKLSKFGPWECTYAYCFPDGTISGYHQIITSSTACTITCY